jgi:signal transduction histidine kinase
VTTWSRARLLYPAAALLLAVITFVDYVTGYELGFFVFYFVPVSLAAWYGSRRAGLFFAFASGACWFLSDRLSLHPYSNALLIYWETLMRLVSYLTTALTLSHIRSDLRQREELLHVVSHDLRAPLGALVGQARALQRRAGADAFSAARVEAILRSASRMDAMIEDLVDTARQASHQLRLRVGPVDVGAYLAELLERCAPQLEAGRVRLALEPAGAPLVALADPDRLERIVMNLLSNALKYSPPESPVELGASASGGWVTIRVADQGPGVPSEDLPHIFDRFYRGKGTVARGGLGLGLYSVRILAEAQGATVRVEPGRLGGTVFQVALPSQPQPGSESASSGREELST